MSDGVHVVGVGPRMFLDITVNALYVGRITIQLRGDVVPVTCNNFRALCTGEMGVGPRSGKPLMIKGTRFHRVVKDMLCVGGDFEKDDGTGGECTPTRFSKDGKMIDENFILRHTGPYVLSMHNTGTDSNGSVFYITFARCPLLDEKHVVFGYVCDGFEVVDAINCVGTPSGRPSADVRIVDCGQLDGFDFEMEAIEDDRAGGEE